MQILKSIRYINMFGLKLFLSKGARRILQRGNFFSKWIVKLNEKNEKDFIRKKIIPNINFSHIYNDKKPETTSKIIWVMWWQGEKRAPELVKKCIQSIKDNANGRKIIFIDQYSYKIYCDIPNCIIRKFRENKISITHFSDILRCYLLAKYGGIWIDATVYITRPIPKDISDQYSFYSVRTGIYTNEPSHGRWTTFFMSAKTSTLLFCFVYQALISYFEIYDEIFDYVLQDYLIAVATELFPECNEMINKVPINNMDVFEMRSLMNTACDKDIFDSSDTYIYKLTWKEQFKSIDKNGNHTLYSNILNS